ncbi:Unknown protein, partial [Striga hermonthica]
LQNFKLSEREEGGISITDDDISAGIQECSQSLFGRIYGEKRVNFTGMRNTLQTVWQTQKPVTARALGHNQFQFIFQTEEDKKRVLTGKTWSFDGQYLLLKEWNPTEEGRTEEADTIQLWVQIWDLPLHWVSAEIGLKVGKLFKEVLDVVVPDMGVYGGRLVKILVELNLKDPILRGTHIRLGGEAKWVHFKYENLLTFCYYCGRIGHADRNCAIKKEDIKKNSLNIGQFGEWLRASVFGYLGGRGNVNSERSDSGLNAEGRKEPVFSSDPLVEEIEGYPPKGRETRLVPSESEAKNQALTQGNKSAEFEKGESESPVDVSLRIVVSNNLDTRKEQAEDLMCLGNLVQVPVQLATKRIIDDLTQPYDRKK